MHVNEITEAIIGASIEVHRALGPGLLESAYVQCLCYELRLRQIPFAMEVSLPVVYKGLKLVVDIVSTSWWPTVWLSRSRR